MFDGNKLIGGSDGLYFMLSLAKTESIKRNKDIYLKITLGTNWCIGVNEDDASCDCNAIPSTCDITSINSVGYEGLTLSSTYTGPKFDRYVAPLMNPINFLRYSLIVIPQYKFVSIYSAQ
jgi:type IV fimbrial biogenesis protein FimT